MILKEYGSPKVESLLLNFMYIIFTHVSGENIQYQFWEKGNTYLKQHMIIILGLDFRWFQLRSNNLNI